MRAATKRALSLSLSGALLVAALAIYGNLILPEYGNIQNLRGTVAAKEKVLEEARNASLNIENLKLAYAKDEKIIESLSLALPEDEAVASLIAQLNAITQASGLSTQSVGIVYLPVKSASAAPSLAKRLGTLRVDAKLSGNYPSFKKFLQDLEENIRIMDTRNLKISQEKDLLNFALTIDAYYQTK